MSSCSCGHPNCFRCNPEVTPDPPEIPRGDLVAAMQTLAAANARMCGIILAADKLAEAAKRTVLFNHRSPHAREALERALQDFEIARSGQ